MRIKMYHIKSLLIATLLAHVAVCAVVSSPAGVPIESSGARSMPSGPESPYELLLQPSIIPPFIPKAADLDLIDADHDGRVTSEEWTKIFNILLAIYDSDGDQALTTAELQAHNLTPPHSDTRLAPPPSKQRTQSVDFKGQLGREHDHLTRKKEQMIRQRDQLYIRDRNSPRSQHRQEQKKQGRP